MGLVAMLHVQLNVMERNLIVTGGNTMKHKVDINELKDFTFEHIVCSASSNGETKRLVAYVCPIDMHMHFIIYYKGEHRVTCNSLDVALFEYNLL